MAGLVKKDENSKQNVVFINACIYIYIYTHRYVEHLPYEYNIVLTTLQLKSHISHMIRVIKICLQ